MPDYDLGKVTGENGSKGDTGQRGPKGDTGKGISSITKTRTSGLVDTYTILFTDNTSTTFNVTNGADGIVDIVDNLTTNDSTRALSAKQGKILKDLIDGIEEDMVL